LKRAYICRGKKKLLLSIELIAEEKKNPGVVLPLNCSTTPIQYTAPILSAVVALNCLMQIKGWRPKKIEKNAQHCMFKARPFD
jgi:hypothetical protein